MGSYRIEFRRSAERDLRKIRTEMLPRILLAIEELASNPRPSGFRKLEGAEHSYRIRVGDYRVLYEVADKLLVVSIEHVRHRRDAYR
jgi:mRNA interferase RelE/StbE